MSKSPDITANKARSSSAPAPAWVLLRACAARLNGHWAGALRATVHATVARISTPLAQEARAEQADHACCKLRLV